MERNHIESEECLISGMKCSINRNLEIASRRKELLMKLARPEEILEKLQFENSGGVI